MIFLSKFFKKRTTKQISVFEKKNCNLFVFYENENCVI